jgi:hypothetical protein
MTFYVRPTEDEGGSWIRIDAEDAARAAEEFFNEYSWRLRDWERGEEVKVADNPLGMDAQSFTVVCHLEPTYTAWPNTEEGA